MVRASLGFPDAPQVLDNNQSAVELTAVFLTSVLRDEGTTPDFSCHATYACCILSPTIPHWELEKE
jgi:hypothetical protein